MQHHTSYRQPMTYRTRGNHKRLFTYQMATWSNIPYSNPPVHYHQRCSPRSTRTPRIKRKLVAQCPNIGNRRLHNNISRWKCKSWRIQCQNGCNHSKNKAGSPRVARKLGPMENGMLRKCRWGQQKKHWVSKQRIWPTIHTSGNTLSTCSSGISHKGHMAQGN